MLRTQDTLRTTCASPAADTAPDAICVVIRGPAAATHRTQPLPTDSEITRNAKCPLQCRRVTHAAARRLVSRRFQRSPQSFVHIHQLLCLSLHRARCCRARSERTSEGAHLPAERVRVAVDGRKGCGTTHTTATHLRLRHVRPPTPLTHAAAAGAGRGTPRARPHTRGATPTPTLSPTPHQPRTSATRTRKANHPALVPASPADTHHNFTSLRVERCIRGSEVCCKASCERRLLVHPARERGSLLRCGSAYIHKHGA